MNWMWGALIGAVTVPLVAALVVLLIAVGSWLEEYIGEGGVLLLFITAISAVVGAALTW